MNDISKINQENIELKQCIETAIKLIVKIEHDSRTSLFSRKYCNQLSIVALETLQNKYNGILCKNLSKEFLG